MRHATWILLAGLGLSALPAAAAPDVSGYLHGTIETTSGNQYEGLLRWGTEEAFWDDHFNASKLDEPSTGTLPDGYRRRTRHVKVFGLEVSGPWQKAWEQRQLIARFGDLAEIDPRGDGATITLRNGRTMRIDGGSNDVGAEITVWDASLGKVAVKWDRIRSIRFSATPADAHPEGERLRAKVHTSVGDFSGFLQWDSQECLTTDLLDGETDDGDMSIPMGKIRSIERLSRRSSRVVLLDGRTVELSGTNDVDASIRNILVEDPRYGRVEIPWSVFEKADLEVAESSGRGYDDYPPLGPIEAKVTTVDGRSRSGPIAFDLDETERWEFLDGSQDDVEYHIPFYRVKEIRRLSGRRTEVTLDNGQKLRLESEVDVDDDNAGIAFFKADGGTAVYFSWDDIDRIELR